MTLEDDKGKERVYTLVGSMESNLDKGLLSVKAPMAMSMLGKKEGENFTLVLPHAKRQFKVVKLEYK